MTDSPRQPPARLLDLVPDIIYEYRLAPPRGFVYVTPSVTAVLGYTPDELYADPELHGRLVHPDDAARLLELAGATGEDRVHLIRVRTRSGDAVTTAQRLRAVRDADGTITSIVGVSRPVAGAADWSIRLGDLVIDVASHRATVGGRTLPLTPSEQQLLALLAAADRTVSRRELVERLWGDYHHTGERAVEVHVSHLRAKLAAAAPHTLRLVTVRGVGYRLVGIAARRPAGAPAT